MPRETHKVPLSEALDASLLSPSLSMEVVTVGEIEGLLRVSETILQDQGIDSQVNGMPAIVSQDSVPVVVDKKHYYARVFMLKPDKNHPERPLPGIAFDETPDVEIVTPNPFALRFMKSMLDQPTLVADQGLDPKVNEPKHVELAGSILRDLAHRNQETKRALAQQAAEKERADMLAHQRRRQRLGSFILKATKVVAGTALGGAVIGGAVFGFSKVDWSSLETPTFDSHNYTLPGGTKIALGESKAPEFSSKLYGNADLSTEKMLTLGNEREYDNVLDHEDTLRELWVTSSKEGKNCESVPVERLPLGSKLVAWTDFTSPAGKSRADELEVKYTTDYVEVCWHGHELSSEDDARVVLKLQPAAK